MSRQGNDSRKSGRTNHVRFDSNVAEVSPCCRQPQNRHSRREVFESDRPAESSGRSRSTLNSALRILDLGNGASLGDPEHRVTLVTPEMKQMAREVVRGQSPRPCTCSLKKPICDCEGVGQCGAKDNKELPGCCDSSPPASAEAIQQATRDAYRTPFRSDSSCDGSPPPSGTEHSRSLEDAGQTPFCPSRRNVYGSRPSPKCRSRHIKFADDSSSRRSAKRKNCSRRKPLKVSTCKRSHKPTSRSTSRSQRECNEDYVSITLTRRELNALTSNLRHRSADSVTIVLKKNRVNCGPKTQI